MPRSFDISWRFYDDGSISAYNFLAFQIGESDPMFGVGYWSDIGDTYAALMPGWAYESLSVQRGLGWHEVTLRSAGEHSFDLLLDGSVIESFEFSLDNTDSLVALGYRFFPGTGVWDDITVGHLPANITGDVIISVIASK